MTDLVFECKKVAIELYSENEIEVCLDEACDNASNAADDISSCNALVDGGVSAAAMACAGAAWQGESARYVSSYALSSVYAYAYNYCVRTGVIGPGQFALGSKKEELKKQVCILLGYHERN